MGRASRTAGVAGTAVSVVAFVATSALAQLPSATTPPAGDSATGWSGYYLSAPLRLSLQNSVPSMKGAFPNCISYEEEGRPPPQLYADVHLTPHLTLSGFGQGGCPIDAAAGGALTYAVPLSSSVQLVLGAGAYAAPAQVPLYGGFSHAIWRGLRGTAGPLQGSLRADMMWKTRSGMPLSIGVGTIGRGRQGITFGGGF